jgi:hypothetical protein
VELLIQRQEGRVRELQAGLLDGNGELQKILSLLQMEFKNMGLPAPVGTPISAFQRHLNQSQNLKAKRRSGFPELPRPNNLKMQTNNPPPMAKNILQRWR